MVYPVRKDDARLSYCQTCRIHALNYRSINDLLDAFPYDKAAIYVSPENKNNLQFLLRELNFDVGGRILINRIDTRVDLVIVHRRRASEPSLLRPAVVVSINGGGAEEKFPKPNITKIPFCKKAPGHYLLRHARNRRPPSCASSLPPRLPPPF